MKYNTKGGLFMIGFIKNLFTIKGYSIEEEDLSFLNEEVEEEKVEFTGHPEIEHIINMLKEKEFNVTKDDFSLDDEDEELEKILHFSFMSIDGSTAYADDYSYSINDENAIPISYDSYLTQVQLLVNPREGKYIIKEKGFTKLALKETNYDEIIKLISEDYWETSSF